MAKEVKVEVTEQKIKNALGSLESKGQQPKK